MMYCDNYCPIDFRALSKDSIRNDATIQLSVYSNKDHYTRDNLRIAHNSQMIEKYDKSRRESNLSGVDIGYAIVKKIINGISGNFASVVFSRLADEGKLFATVTEHRYYSIGSYERIALTEEFFRNKHAVFLDRDGTLNVRPLKAHYIERPDDFIWLSGAVDAIKLLNENKVITILVTNQPGIARGNLTENTLNAIHEKMQSDLKQKGARIDYIYYCPHNWNDGCECRKPKPGMLYQAQRDLSLNLKKCVFFGDDERDMEAGNTAGCKTVLISEKYTLIDAVKAYLLNLKNDLDSSNTGGKINDNF